MLNVIRGVLGGLLGALTSAVLFVVTSYVLALIVGPVTGSLPGLYLSIVLGTLAGLFLAMGVQARLGRTLKLLGASLGLGVVGLMVAHFAGRLLYWGVGDKAGSLEALGGISPEARMGVYAISIVGALVGVLAGSVLAASDGPRPAKARRAASGAASVEEAAETEPSPPKKAQDALPRSKAPGVDEVPMGEHPADSMSVEELLGDQE